MATPKTPQTLKSRLKNGETLYGLFLLSNSPTLAEIAGLSGYDYVVVDLEHGPGGISDALACLHALSAARTSAIIRIPDHEPMWVKKSLDIGAQGIMFPMIESQKMAKKVVSYCRYPPNGIRGGAHHVVRASGYGIDNQYLSNIDDKLLIVCQVESEEGVKKIEEIAAVDGVDCVHMGPTDLSISMGYLGDRGNKKVKEMMRTAEKGVLKTTGNGKDKDGGGGAYLGGIATPFDTPEDMRSRGYHMISGALDIAIFRDVCVEDVKRFKGKAVSNDEDLDSIEINENGKEKY
ncbi:Aldehyde-lyase domain-containing protein [Artemisia annua]|uniref:Aldehyde-lyase domain-containing protein n=1 Tax=Artemisia annua TaxID=35608 RepID=A0A2U1KCS2_ARTAN|nr:Aldehyde-lyase domain-containing protein [Artemisia annua]